MAFTDKGVEHVDGYWKLTRLALDCLAATGRVVFSGYHDRPAREADAAGNALVTRLIPVTPDLYAQFIAENADIRAQCYLLAKAGDFAAAADC